MPVKQRFSKEIWVSVCEFFGFLQKGIAGDVFEGVSLGKNAGGCGRKRYDRRLARTGEDQEKALADAFL